jgi:hypothetical protein
MEFPCGPQALSGSVTADISWLKITGGAAYYSKNHKNP